MRTSSLVGTRVWLGLVAGSTVSLALIAGIRLWHDKTDLLTLGLLLASGLLALGVVVSTLAHLLRADTTATRPPKRTRRFMLLTLLALVSLILLPASGSLYWAQRQTQKTLGRSLDTLPAWFWQRGVSMVAVACGNGYVAQGKLTQAHDCAKRAVAADPKYPEAYQLRGEVAQLRGDYQAAFDDYSLALAWRPTAAKLWYQRGYVGHMQRRYAQAVADYTKALAYTTTTSERVELLRNRAAAHTSLGDCMSAVLDLDAAIELAPHESAIVIQRLECYLIRQQYFQARADLNRLIGELPERADLYYWRAQTALGQRDYAAALEDLNACIERDPQYVEAYVQRGQLYGYKGEKGRATIEFARVLELTDDPELRAKAEAGLRASAAFPFVNNETP